MSSLSKKAVLLLNLGTPDDPSVSSVRRYLKQFLMDPYVIDIAYPLRWLLVNTVISIFRAPKSAEAYQLIWTEKGSPLSWITQELSDRLSSELEAQTVAWAMRYGKPSIFSVLKKLRDQGVDELQVIPLYPQYAMSSTESSLEEVKKSLRKLGWSPSVRYKESFYDDDGFIEALCEKLQVIKESFQPDFYLLSFHGLPVRHLHKVVSPNGEPKHCLQSDHCCDSGAQRNCYRAQSFITAKLLSEKAAIPKDQYKVTFQSRLGRDPWIEPFTDHEIPRLAQRGVRRLAVACPSFVADCLETLEEIQMRAKEQFVAEGGEDLILVPCVNSSASFVKALKKMVDSSSNWKPL